jgi:hypothetical protein
MLKYNQRWVTNHGAKEEVIKQHYNASIGGGEPRAHDFNWEELKFSKSELDDLDDPITEEEVQNADFPSGKAPGLDGLTRIFFKKCCPIIKTNVMMVVEQFGSHHVVNLRCLNSANIVLVPKKRAHGGCLGL